MRPRPHAGSSYARPIFLRHIVDAESLVRQRHAGLDLGRRQVHRAGRAPRHRAAAAIPVKLHAPDRVPVDHALKVVGGLPTAGIDLAGALACLIQLGRVDTMKADGDAANLDAVTVDHPSDAGDDLGAGRVSDGTEDDDGGEDRAHAVATS